MGGDPVTRLAVRVWLDVPWRLIRRFPGLHGVVGDGHFLLTVPPVAVCLPIVAVASGVVIGAGGLGYEDVYTESVALMAAAIALGCFATQLGLLALAGFAAADFFLRNRIWSLGASPLYDGALDSGLLGGIARVRIPLLITYLLLGLAVVVVPRSARAVVSAVGRWGRIPTAMGWLLATALYVAAVALGVRAWAAAATTLIRPRFTWAVGSFGTPTVRAIKPLEDQAADLIVAAVAAATIRQVVIGIILLLGSRVRSTETQAAAERVALSAPAESTPGGTIAAHMLVAAAATLVLAGLLEHAYLWIVVFSVFLGVRLLRADAVAWRWLETWKRLISRAPAAARLVVLWVAIVTVTDQLIPPIPRGSSTTEWWTVDSYTDITFLILIGVIVAFAILPGLPASAIGTAGKGPPSAEASR